MAQMDRNKPVRLDKYLTEMGKGSRASVKQWIKKGCVLVDGSRENRPERKIVPGETQVSLNGENVAFVSCEYVMLYKPAGCVSATEDGRERTVLEYLREEDCVRRKDLFPVGRLDKDTEGLLLLTNDGGLAHRLLSPRKHVWKKYYVQLRDAVCDEDIECFDAGMDIGDEKKTLPARLQYADLQDRRKVYVSLKEGRFHQIKRMFAARGNEVVYLKRLQMGALKLDESLKPGEYRHLTAEELELLNNEGNGIEDKTDEE